MAWVHAVLAPKTGILQLRSGQALGRLPALRATSHISLACDRFQGGERGCTALRIENATARNYLHLPAEAAFGCARKVCI